MEKGRLFVISGPSGAGKGTVCGRLMQDEPNIQFSVSATTRAPREGEQHGVHYFFISNEQFDEMVQQNAFLEYADVFGMNRYGTPRAYVEERLQQGKDIILDIDVQGAENVKKAYPEAVLVFILPPSAAILEQRLRDRGTETNEQILRRLETAKKEVAKAALYDYIVINDQVDRAVDELRSIVHASRAQAQNRLEWLHKNWR